MALPTVIIGSETNLGEVSASRSLSSGGNAGICLASLGNGLRFNAFLLKY